jgi:hypothetical protein
MSPPSPPSSRLARGVAEQAVAEGGPDHVLDADVVVALGFAADSEAEGQADVQVDLDLVARRAEVRGVAALAAVEDVGAEEALEDVVARLAEELVVGEGADQRIGPGGPVLDGHVEVPSRLVCFARSAMDGGCGGGV